jgi:hypothetical protein
MGAYAAWQYGRQVIRGGFVAAGGAGDGAVRGLSIKKAGTFEFVLVKAD